MHIDKYYCGITIKEIQKNINSFLDASGWDYTKAMTKRTARKIKWYL